MLHVFIQSRKNEKLGLFADAKLMKNEAKTIFKVQKCLNYNSIKPHHTQPMKVEHIAIACIAPVCRLFLDKIGCRAKHAHTSCIGKSTQMLHHNVASDTKYPRQHVHMVWLRT